MIKHNIYLLMYIIYIYTKGTKKSPRIINQKFVRATGQFEIWFI